LVLFHGNLVCLSGKQYTYNGCLVAKYAIQARRMCVLICAKNKERQKITLEHVNISRVQSMPRH